MTCLFLETATQRARASRRSLLDVPYGDGEGEKLDIYFPKEASEGERGLLVPWGPRWVPSLGPHAPRFVPQRCLSSCFFTEVTGRVEGEWGGEGAISAWPVPCPRPPHRSPRLGAGA